VAGFELRHTLRSFIARCSREGAVSKIDVLMAANKKLASFGVVAELQRPV
jgi:hypothetical protein